ncbi:uncharacterized protein SAPINGB_P002806 [Magnusiomyces paraingens]|uniref:Homologous-pairing protein 2 winged helix domain-containing protein n=1 Tax=Magnusiomyces paraingens TaxID=2606893 RepID=A0A5E8BFY1_9ASCO|nr:uncharacterized protein SAPINGB_P002806 [Saprochaete ingens]VVT50566.1 unnamed protein product [Saprochaete ingens]
MSMQNRPYAVTDIITNLHGVIGKTLAIKVLAGLVEENKLLAKTYGKTIVYVVKQGKIKIATSSPTDAELFTKISSLQDRVKSVNEELKDSTDPNYKPLTVAEIKKLEDDLCKLDKIVIRRTKLALILWNTIKDNVSNNAEIEESLGLEW